jgi:hypothetical protein
MTDFFVELFNGFKHFDQQETNHIRCLLAMREDVLKTLNTEEMLNDAFKSRRPRQTLDALEWLLHTLSEIDEVVDNNQ